MELLKVSLLFAITAVAEIVGCYLPWLVLKQGKPTWLLVPAAVSLALFAWLLTLHPTAAGREAGARNRQEGVECGPERPLQAAAEVRRLPQEPPPTHGNWRKQTRKSPN